jgi:hypothetical protein
MWTVSRLALRMLNESGADKASERNGTGGKYRSSIQPIPCGRTGDGKNSDASPTAILSAVVECASAVSDVPGDVEVQDTHFPRL